MLAQWVLVHKENIMKLSEALKGNTNPYAGFNPQKQVANNYQAQNFINSYNENAVGTDMFGGKAAAASTAAEAGAASAASGVSWAEGLLAGSSALGVIGSLFEEPQTHFSRGNNSANTQMLSTVLSPLTKV